MVFDITVAVEVGMVLAAFLFIRRISETTRISGVDERGFDEGSTEGNTAVVVPKGVMVYNVFGAFLFGAADKLETALQRSQQEPEVLILKMRQVLAMDATGLQALEDLARRLRARGKHLLLCGPHSQPLFAMNRHGFIDWLGQDNVCADLELSLVRARKLLGANEDGSPSAADPAKVSEATP